MKVTDGCRHRLQITLSCLLKSDETAVNAGLCTAAVHSCQSINAAWDNVQAAECVCDVFFLLSLQILLAGRSGEKVKIQTPNPNQACLSIQWLCTGCLLWPPLLTGQWNKVRSRQTLFPANAHRTTEVPLIGLTIRSILPPHRSLTLRPCSASDSLLLQSLPTSPTTSKETPHILPKMLSCTFTFLFDSSGHAHVLCLERLLCQSWRNGPVIKVTSSLTPLQDPCSHILHSSLFSL